MGLFIGVQPLYGLHLLLCFAVCLPLRLDVLVAYAAANVSNPLLAPLIVVAELQIGSLLVDGTTLALPAASVNATVVGHLAWQLGTGAVALGAGLAVLGGWSAAVIVRRATRGRTVSRSTRSDLSRAIARTRERYRLTPTADRRYVVNKLRFDSIVRVLCEVTAGLGNVVDVGCGRGQLGLVLLELGKVDSLSGFDWDERKVSVARMAAAGDAQYTVSDLRSADIAEADTILVVDVLHYLPHADQDALLSRIATALRPGGTLIVREVDARVTLSSLFTRWCERVGVRFGVNRGHALWFRSRKEHCQALARHGLVVSQRMPIPGLFLDNVLLVAVRPDA